MEVSVSFFTREKVSLSKWERLCEFLCGRKWNHSIILCVPYMDSISDLLQKFVIIRCCKISFRYTRCEEMNLVDCIRKLSSFRKILEEKTSAKWATHKSEFIFRIQLCKNSLKDNFPFTITSVEFIRHSWIIHLSSISYPSSRYMCTIIYVFPIFPRSYVVCCICTREKVQIWLIINKWLTTMYKNQRFHRENL